MYSTAKTNTAGSHTTKKSRDQHLKSRARDQALAEVMSNVMVRLLDQWSVEELRELTQSSPVMCLQVADNSYRIGHYDLTHSGENWSVTDTQQHQLQQDFYSKQAAVFYCVFGSRNDHGRALDLLTDDRQLFQLKTQIDIYYQQLKIAVERQDEWKKDLYMARLSHLRPQLEQARNNLQKKIRTAKYSKAWDLNHEIARDRY